MTDEPNTRSWWATLPGLLTGLAGVVTAVAGVIAVIERSGSSTFTDTGPDVIRHTLSASIRSGFVLQSL
jgi:hypothetical protein